jgi:hypothetical protein
LEAIAKALELWDECKVIHNLGKELIEKGKEILDEHTKEGL